MTEIRVTQSPAEVLADPDEAAALVTQLDAEVLADPDLAAGRVTQLGVDVLGDPDTRTGRVSQISVEVLRHAPLPVTPPGPIARPTVYGQGEQTRALAVNIFAPIVQGKAFIDNFSEEITAYSHEKGADNYYNSASITLTLPEVDVADWLLYGLGRHIEVKSPAQNLIWEGFVDRLTIAYGGKAYEIGPLSDIGNRVYVTYTPVYISSATGTIVKGTSAETPLVDNTTSQAIYGIIEKNLSAGECIVTDTQNEAERFRNEFLTENAYPKIQGNYSFMAGGTGAIVLECSGYWKWLDYYVYNYRTGVAMLGWVTLNTKLQAILAAEPNAIISTDYTLITANAAIAQNMEKNNKTALTIIKGITAAGDATANRWLFGVGKDRIAYYHVLPTTIDYEYRVNDEMQKLVVYGTDAAVEPWDIEPGKWYITNDIYKPITAGTPYSVPSASFIETVRFTAPYSFDLTEGKMSRVSQLLNMKGLGSI